MIIKHGKNNYQVFSKAGKPLSKPGLTEEQAKERLKQVEHYAAKNNKDKKK